MSTSLIVDKSTEQDFLKETRFIGNFMHKQVSSLLNGLQECRQKGLYTDVILCASGEEFPCHKVVLAASSRYFNAMFLTPFAEQQTSRVNLKQVSPWVLRHLIDFAYTGRLALNTTVVQDIFVGANFLDYPLAVEACIDFMKKHLHVSNCLGVQLLAEVYEFPDLAKSARIMAVENFSTLVNPDEPMIGEWLQLPLKSVESYLSADDLEVRSERVVLEACLAWVAYDPEKRISHLPGLLHLVRLYQLSPTLLRTYTASSSSIIHESPTALLYIEQVISRMEGKCDQLVSVVNGNTSAVTAASLLPRPSTLKRPTLVAVGGINSTYILDSVDAFSFVRGRCLPCPPMPASSLTWFSAAVADNTLVITGGIHAGEIVSTVYRFSVEENTWNQGRSMPIARARHASVAVRGGHVFLFGGVTVVLATTPFPESSERSRQTEVAVEGVEAVNSWGSEVPDLLLVDSIDRYDVWRDEWTTVGRSRYPRQMSSVAVVSPLQVTEGSPPQMIGERESDVCANAPTHTVVELGGTLDVQSDLISEKMAIYHIKPDLCVDSADDYIALLRPVRYAKCVTNQLGNLVYIFWEASGELSVLDFHRQSLRTLRSLTEAGRSDGGYCAVHCGCAWVDGHLYVVGGFSAFLGANQKRPIAPRHSIHCYDPCTDAWSEISVFKDEQATLARAICSCVSLEM
ncbi:ectoderm neural cortex protein 1 [Echinococcus multilocularis]|uniref:Ectoderm neural cortex protein 1 n=1 Tax=Echinococcus multilocularis TaxID=6211 RepID=A0A068Y823_ECHMU|nr:ectoderm neural cortex protein 1 [Echinococcus multilocularis]